MSPKWLLFAGVLPTAAFADDTLKVVAAPRDFDGQKVTVSCQIAYAQDTSPTWCEVYDGSGKEIGTIYVYLTSLPHQEDRQRAMRDCANQNPSKNNRERCLVTLTGRIGFYSQKPFLNDPVVEWVNK